MCLCYLFCAKTAWQLVNRKPSERPFFYKTRTNRFESIRITNRIDSNRELECSTLCTHDCLVSPSPLSRCERPTQSVWSERSYEYAYCKLTTGRSHLRSANACLLSVPRTRTTYGDRSFAVSGPVAWNSLPVALRSSDVTEETLRRQLKTFLFNYLDNWLCR